MLTGGLLWRAGTWLVTEQVRRKNIVGARPQSHGIRAEALSGGSNQDVELEE
jgi:hypothetical protein